MEKTNLNAKIFQLEEIPEKSYRDHLAFLNETEEGDL